MYSSNMSIVLAALVLATSCEGVGGRESDGSEATLPEAAALSSSAGGAEPTRSSVGGQEACQPGDTVSSIACVRALEKSDDTTEEVETPPAKPRTNGKANGQMSLDDIK